jgi:hypothetical protein
MAGRCLRAMSAAPTSRHRCDRITTRLAPHVAVAPSPLANKVQQPIVHSVALLLIATCASGNRLDTLTLAVAEQSERVRRERGALILATNVLA